jgi:hypothetical protein
MLPHAHKSIHASFLRCCGRSFLFKADHRKMREKNVFLLLKTRMMPAETGGLGAVLVFCTFLSQSIFISLARIAGQGFWRFRLFPAILFRLLKSYAYR